MTALAGATGRTAAAGGARAAGALLTMLLQEERSQLSAALVSSLLLPALFCYAIALIARGEGDPDLPRASAIGLTLGLGGVAAQVGGGVLGDRFQGRLDLLRAQPLPKAAYCGTRLALGLLGGLVFFAFAWSAMCLLGVVAPDARSLLAGAAVSLCVAAALGSLGAAIAASAKDWDSGWTAVSAGLIAVGMASPVLYPMEALPLLVRPLTLISPFTHAAPQFRALVADAPVPPTAVAGTLCLTALYVGIGYRAIRWDRS